MQHDSNRSRWPLNMLRYRRLMSNKWHVQRPKGTRQQQQVLSKSVYRQVMERPGMSTDMRGHRCVDLEAIAIFNLANLTCAEPNRNTSLVYHCQQKESWCCAYVGEKGFKDWPKHDLINTTCCSIPDLTFKTQDPTVFATALLYIRPSDLVSIQPSSNTEFSSISLAKTGTGMDITGLPTADSNGSSGENVQQGSSTGLSTGAKIGLGVGIPIAIIGLAAIGAIFCLRKRRATGAKDTPELFAPDASNKHNVPPCQETAMDHHGGTTYRHEAPSPNTAAELPATDNMAELPSQSKPLI
jgi:hypothetical protein